MQSSAYLIPEQEWESQMALYKIMESDASLAIANTSLKNFQSNHSTKNIGKLVNADGLAKIGNSKTAKTKLATISNPNTIEKLNKDYRNLILELSLYDSLVYDSIFKSQVLNIANACEDNGLVVKQARVLTRYLYNDNSLVFNNNCGSGSRIIQQVNIDNENIVNDKLNTYHIIPNPNNGLFDLYNESIEDKTTILINIVDLSGKVVYKRMHEIQNKFCKFDLNQLNKGIYLLRINNESVSKLVIQ